MTTGYESILCLDISQTLEDSLLGGMYLLHMLSETVNETEKTPTYSRELVPDSDLYDCRIMKMNQCSTCCHKPLVG